jgi:hypothetical protein
MYRTRPRGGPRAGLLQPRRNSASVEDGGGEGEGRGGFMPAKGLQFWMNEGKGGDLCMSAQ